MLNITTIYQDEILRVNTYSLKNKRKGCYMQKKLLMIEHETEKEFNLGGAIRYIFPIFICILTLLTLSMYFLH